MLSYNEIFSLYQACRQQPNDQASKAELTSAFLPYIELWATDVLSESSQRVKRAWRDDIVAEGALKLVARLKKLVLQSKADGKHLVDSLRLSVKNAMERALHERFVVPFVKPETIKARIDRGQPDKKPWELAKQVNLESASQQNRIRLTNRVTHVDPKFFDRDPNKSYRYFVTMTCNEACRIARELGWTFVELMYEKELNQTEVAKLTGINRRTIGDRLRKLAWRIAGSASDELDELGRQFMRKEWIAAAETAIAQMGGEPDAKDDEAAVPNQQLKGGSPLVAPMGQGGTPEKISKIRRIDSAKKALAWQRNKGRTTSELDEISPPDQSPKRCPIPATTERHRASEKISKKLRFDSAENVLARQRNMGRRVRGSIRRTRHSERGPAVPQPAGSYLHEGWSVPDLTVAT